MSDDKSQGNDDGLVTSAPASSVGSLLTDLLDEAQAEVQKERASLERQLHDKGAEERMVRDREEARQRDVLQAKLIEETRRRNQALTRQEKVDLNVHHAQEQVKKHDSMLRRLEGAAEFARLQTKRTKVILIGLVAVLIVGGGITAALIASQPEGMSMTMFAGVTDGIMKDAQLTYLGLKNAETMGRLEAEQERLQAAIANAKTEAEKTKLLEEQKAAAEKLLEVRKADEAAQIKSSGGGTAKKKLTINTGVFGR